MDYSVTEVAQILKEDLDKKENCTSYGEPQAFFALDDGRSIELVIEQEGLSPAEYFYSASLHCTEAEFENGDFDGTNGIIDRYVSRDLSLEELWDVVGAALVSDYEKPVAQRSKVADKVSLSEQIAAAVNTSRQLSDDPVTQKDNWTLYNGAWIYPIEDGWEANLNGFHYDDASLEVLKEKIDRAVQHPSGIDR